MVNEADRIAPNRAHLSDGSIGDAAHASRSSYHNPQNGVVDALDLTHDPRRGFDAHARARLLVARGDPRLDHVISNHQIWSVKSPHWRTYTGINPHTKHAHFAVKRNATGRLSTRAWWPMTSPPIPPPPPVPDPIPPLPSIDLPEDDDMAFIMVAPARDPRLKDGPTFVVLSAEDLLEATKRGFRTLPVSQKHYDETRAQVIRALDE